MSYGILLLRVVVGLAFVGHGTQKLFGWFGGTGRREPAGSWRQRATRAGVLMAVAAGPWDREDPEMGGTGLEAPC